MIGRIRLLISSIATKAKIIPCGAPEGTRWDKNKPKEVRAQHVNIVTQRVRVNLKTSTIFLVGVGTYGNRPKKLLTQTAKKTNKINGMIFTPITGRIIKEYSFDKIDFNSISQYVPVPQLKNSVGGRTLKARAESHFQS